MYTLVAITHDYVFAIDCWQLRDFVVSFIKVFQNEKVNVNFFLICELGFGWRPRIALSCYNGSKLNELPSWYMQQ